MSMTHKTLRDMRLLELIGYALDIPPKDRKRALLERYSDKALVKDALQMLEGGETDNGFLTHPLDAIRAVNLAQTVGEPDKAYADLTGSTVGPFTIVSRLGEGGMGTVYEATQSDPIDRTVALKVMSRSLDGIAGNFRFGQEVQAMARMNHPNIGQIFDAGTTDSGFPYFVMELIEGVPITRFCEERQLNIGERLSLFHDVCKAVHHAHQKRILHLDIKPSNVLVSDFQGEAVVKVIDFGIARNLDLAPDGKLENTSTPTMGTPSYASPEMMNPAMVLEDLDTQADVYSLGVLLYELLCGEYPQQLSGRSAKKIYASMMSQGIDAPSVKLAALESENLNKLAQARQTKPKALIHELEGDLDAVAMKAVQFDREARYSTANELAMDIRNYQGKQPVVARPWTRRYLFGRFVARNRLPVAALSTVFVVLIAGIATITMSLNQARQAARDSAATVDFLEQLLQANNPYETRALSAAAHTELTVRQLLELGADKALNSLEDQPAIQARVLYTLGDILRAYPDPEAPVPLLEKAVALRGELYGDDHEETIESRLALGWAYERLGRYEDSEQELSRAYESARAILPYDARDLIDAQRSLAKIRFTQTRSAESRQELETALNAAVRADADFLLIGDLLNTLGWDAFYQEQPERAVAFMSRALELYEQHFEPDHPSIALMQNNLAVMSLAAGQVQQAEALALSAVSTYERTIEPDHWRIANAQAVLGTVRMHQRRFDEAERLMLDALPRVAEGTGETTVYTLSILRELETLYQQWDKPQKAADIAQRLQSLE